MTYCKSFFFIIVSCSFLFVSCGNDSKKQNKNVGQEDFIKEAPKPTPLAEETVVKKQKEENQTVSPSEPIAKKNNKSEALLFSEITSKTGIKVDIKYATKDNFTKKQIYPCGKCYLRPEVATAIEKANQLLKLNHGYNLKMFDCYRPRPAQQRLWDVVPNADYVTPPAKGSMHNKGLAVDLTIVDENGKDLDMGTPYDFFGEEAHTDNLKHPKHVLENRSLLKQVMEQVGLTGIRTEWWHFSYKGSASLSDWEWDCE